AGADYAIEGLRGSAFYLWPMRRALVESARMVAVHDAFVAGELRERHPTARIERIRLGTPDRVASPAARAEIRRNFRIPHESVVFVMFGLVTAEKRIEPVLRALGTLSTDAHLLIVGASGFSGLEDTIAASGVAGRVHVTGY